MNCKKIQCAQYFLLIRFLKLLKTKKISILVPITFFSYEHNVLNSTLFPPPGGSTSFSGPAVGTPNSFTPVVRPQIGIVHHVYNAPTGPDSPWDYSFETENGIRQEAQGSIKQVRWIARG